MADLYVWPLLLLATTTQGSNFYGYPTMVNLSWEQWPCRRRAHADVGRRRSIVGSVPAVVTFWVGRILRLSGTVAGVAAG